ncbi:hypothetical protein JBF11_03555 [Taurinivorans muris]|mgnify:CR=1 FL=1|uniref:Phage protein D n=1 Tax=Taurinivorans muris TaxID=2787751 RepID=A0ABY5Y2W0_9BACT|nr:hypothetical protein JBF11_03555 [Desulfovibrionaceae bacterium LT0009]
MLTQKTRRAYVRILYKNKELTRDITQFIAKFEYTERLDGEADDISLSFLDKYGTFIYEHFLPDRGDTLIPTLYFEHWYKEDEIHEVSLGEFEVDEFEIENSLGSQIISIKAVPALVNSSLAGQKKNRAWENVKLSAVAGDIANTQGVELLYQAKEILLRRVDQKNQSDLVFLAGVCRQNGLRLKVADNKIIIEESKEQEKRRIITQSDYCSFNVRVQSQDVYNGVHIKYYDALEEKDFEYQFTPQNAPKVGKVLELNDRVKNFAEAEQVAKARLREKNKKAVELTMKIYPNPFIRCGTRLEFSPVAYLGETFIVSEMNYSLDGKTLLQNLKLNLCLEY